MQANDKVMNLLGFAINAGKIIFGIDNVNASKRKKFLVISCKSLGENSFEQLLNKNPNTSILVCKYTLLSEVVHRKNCKIIAVTDKQIATAILDRFNNGMYDLIVEGK